MRFLLADDPGAGKTVMAGLLLKEGLAFDRSGNLFYAGDVTGTLMAAHRER